MVNYNVKKTHVLGSKKIFLESKQTNKNTQITVHLWALLNCSILLLNRKRANKYLRVGS